MDYKIITDFDMVENKNGGYTLTKFIGFDEKDIEIPSYIDGKRITALGNGLFSGNKVIKNVLIAEGIEKIGDKVFFSSSIESIVLPNTIRILGKQVFESADKIREINFPDSVEKIGKAICKNCHLRTVILPRNLETIPEDSFADSSIWDGIIFPENLKIIETNAFNECRFPGDHLYLPNKLEIIKESAFYGAKMGNYAFPCIYFPNSIKLIEQYAFYGIEGYAAVFERGCAAELAGDCFGYDWKMIYLPATIASIGDDFCSDETKIYCEKNSVALDYARKNNNPCADYNEDYDSRWGRYSFKTREYAEKRMAAKAEQQARDRIDFEYQQKKKEKKEKRSDFTNLLIGGGFAIGLIALFVWLAIEMFT